MTTQTRQTIRREGIELEKRMRSRARQEARKARQKNLPRKGMGADEIREARRLSRGWFKRHENPRYRMSRSERLLNPKRKAA